MNSKVNSTCLRPRGVFALLPSPRHCRAKQAGKPFYSNLPRCCHTVPTSAKTPGYGQRPIYMIFEYIP
jgi:hypothetical protein